MGRAGGDRQTAQARQTVHDLFWRNIHRFRRAVPCLPPRRPRSDRGGTESANPCRVLRPEVVVWLDHAPIYLSRGRCHDVREDLCAAARSSIVHTSMLLTLTGHSHGWPL